MQSARAVLSGSTKFLDIITKMARISKNLLKIKCVFSFSLQILFGTLLILTGIQRDIAINVQTSACKLGGSLVTFYSNFKFLDRFSRKTQM
jgi:hypothetical protein